MMYEKSTGKSKPSVNWRHYYRCPRCHDDWAHVDKKARAVDSCPLCARRMLPYESEICPVVKP